MIRGEGQKEMGKELLRWPNGSGDDVAYEHASRDARHYPWNR